MKRLSIVIPVYNSSKTIERVVGEIDQAMDKIVQIKDFEVVLVNDNSKDNSLEICKKLSNEKSYVKVISLSRNFGQHNAIMAGLSVVQGDYIICMDDDLQTPAYEIKTLIDALEKDNFDIVYGRYEHKKHSKFRNIGTEINYLMATSLINQPKEIQVTSLFVMKKFIVEEIIKYENPYPYLSGLIFRVTKNIGNAVVEHRERKVGKSNYNLTKLVKLWLNGFTNFSVKPLRISAILGFFFSLISFIFMLYLVVKKLIDPEIQIGYTSTMVTIVFFGALQLITVGLLGEYIGRIFMCINKAPQYVISEIYNINKNKEKEGNNDIQ
jgi:undecaprenyl-phosphate 4-deoxy-4-formamido-L-arabinose transferase